MFHTYRGETIRFETTYKNRSSVGLTIDAYGTIGVLAPKGMTEKEIGHQLEANWDAILHSINEMNERRNGAKERVYEQGEPFLFLGRNVPIKVTEEPSLEKDYVILEDHCLKVHVRVQSDEKVKQAIKRFYYQQCKAIVEKRVRENQRHFKITPSSIRISDSKTTWGTCDSKRQLTFNWRLAMAPMEVIDYVVVHEMCHLLHLNHDRSFWRLVGKIMPDYKEKEKWLALSHWKMTV
ncbi:M48 family metallopeptidase [Metabacillus sp. HB246100]